jgi:3-phosphoshikimate 1-carboxyvinyltransferase
MGVQIEVAGEVTTVHGVGMRGLSLPAGPIDCGNSGTTMRLLAGLLSPQHFGLRLTGDASLSRRPMQRIVSPLRARGAHIKGATGEVEGEQYAPLGIAPLVASESLLGLEYEMPVASAQVKSALLLSGLYAKGPTALQEPVLSRDHTERMFMALGVPLQTLGGMCVLDPEGWTPGWGGVDWRIPGDLSSAAFLMAAVQLVPGSSIVVEDVGVNPTRTGLLDLMRIMGARSGVIPKPDAAGMEPAADLEFSHQVIRGGPVGGELLVRMIDEVPALCALAAVCTKKIEIHDAEELRVKESDRLSAMANVLSEFGVPCREKPDGLVVDGGRKVRAARVHSQGDHRIAMAAAVLALRAEGESVIEDVDCVETSFPGFAETLQSLGADIEECST